MCPVRSVTYVSGRSPSKTASFYQLPVSLCIQTGIFPASARRSDLRPTSLSEGRRKHTAIKIGEFISVAHTVMIRMDDGGPLDTSVRWV
jgi:hypothetical protein